MADEMRDILIGLLDDDVHRVDDHGVGGAAAGVGRIVAVAGHDVSSS